MARVWTCRKCRTTWPRTKQLCACGGRRPAARKPKHTRALDDPYEIWVARFGGFCGICGAEPTAKRRLDRDHCHDTGEARGLLCHRCNRALPSWVTEEWLAAALAYLRRSRGGGLHVLGGEAA